MFDLMYEAKGIGLAANQVGIPYRFFVLNLTADPEKKDQEQVFINPEIVKRHSSIEDEEGCLSFPGLYAKVRRARKIKVRAFDLEGNPVELDAEDLASRAIQHETDHLAGRLFIDLSSPPSRRLGRRQAPRVRGRVPHRPRPRANSPATTRSSGSSTGCESSVVSPENPRAHRAAASSPTCSCLD